MRFILSAIVMGIFSSALTSVHGQTVRASSTPIGYMQVKVPGKGTGSGVSFLGTPFLREVVYEGTLDDGKPVGSKLGDQDAAWAVGAFVQNGAGPPSHYVEIIFSGNPEAVGLISDIVNHTATQLTTADDLSAHLLGGEQFCVRPHHTLATLFGTSNGGTNEQPDTISVLKPGENASFATYYYRQAQLGGEGWRSAANPFTDESARPVRPADGMYVQRSATTDRTIILHGEVRTRPARVPIKPGLNIVSTMQVSSDAGAATLGRATDGSTVPSGLEEVLTEGNSATADTVSVFGGTSFSTYYRKDASVPLGGAGWRSISNPFIDQSDIAIPAGGAVLIRNRSGVEKLWTIPAPVY